MFCFGYMSFFTISLFCFFIFVFQVEKFNFTIVIGANSLPYMRVSVCKFSFPSVGDFVRIDVNMFVEVNSKVKFYNFYLRGYCFKMFSFRTRKLRKIIWGILAPHPPPQTGFTKFNFPGLSKFDNLKNSI